MNENLLKDLQMEHKVILDTYISMRIQRKDYLKLSNKIITQIIKLESLN